MYTAYTNIFRPKKKFFVFDPPSKNGKKRQNLHGTRCKIFPIYGTRGFFWLNASIGFVWTCLSKKMGPIWPLSILFYFSNDDFSPKLDGTRCRIFPIYGTRGFFCTNVPVGFVWAYASKKMGPNSGLSMLKKLKIAIFGQKWHISRSGAFPIWGTRGFICINVPVGFVWAHASKKKWTKNDSSAHLLESEKIDKSCWKLDDLGRLSR